MKKRYVIVVLMLLGMFNYAEAQTLKAKPNLDRQNLITNPTFQNIGSNGDPEGWHRGGYGQNSASFEVVPCEYYTEADLLLPVTGITFRPRCPASTINRLRVSIGNYISGDAKWYFDEVKINGEKEYLLSYQYQAYTSRAQATARYTMKDGSYQYVLVSNLPPLELGGNGYVRWTSATQRLNPPKKATAVTVFFSVKGNDDCVVTCIGPEMGTLSIANVVLKKDK